VNVLGTLSRTAVKRVVLAHVQVTKHRSSASKLCIYLWILILCKVRRPT